MQVGHEVSPSVPREACHFQCQVLAVKFPFKLTTSGTHKNFTAVKSVLGQTRRHTSYNAIDEMSNTRNAVQIIIIMETNNIYINTNICDFDKNLDNFQLKVIFISLVSFICSLRIQ